MQDANKKKEAGASQKINEKSKSQVLGTAGGEIPDPPKMPSKTKFHSDAPERKSTKENK